MSIYIDAIGKACPMPVIMAKKEIEKNYGEFLIAVDNAIAVENLKKLATKLGYFTVTKQKEDEIFYVSFNTDKDAKIPDDSETENFNVSKSSKDSAWVVFMGKETIGEGDYQLGILLTEMFFYTLTQADDRPESILFMNSGVKLVVNHKRVIEHLQVLKDLGVHILVCGTCLDYYGLMEDHAIGEVSNMYDITEKIFSASKVVTLS